MVYDAPLLSGNFKKRLNVLEVAIEKNNSPHVVMHKQIQCKSVQHLDAEMDRVIAEKGEGLMIKDPKSQYEGRRSKELLKVKRFEDAEATVLAHLQGTGRLCFTTGAIQVKNDSGKIFKIGSGFTDKERNKPPKIGSRVTYKYQGLTKDGIPRFPIF
mmetsp:Transcript_2487/g.4183  ORF Transcript_2487/g.4183 Transcript_2487/m.4183 type:complete len:157 (+) Transcript_2487:756-1226(+)